MSDDEREDDDDGREDRPTEGEESIRDDREDRPTEGEDPDPPDDGDRTADREERAAPGESDRRVPDPGEPPGTGDPVGPSGDDEPAGATPVDPPADRQDPADAPTEIRDRPGDVPTELRDGPGDDRHESGDARRETGEDADRSGPLEDVAAEVRRRQERDADRSRPAEDLFEESGDETAVDREALWRQVAGEDAVERIAEVDPEIDAGPEVRDAGGVAVEDRTERLIEKRKYCQKCEYFSPPPDVRCTHQGTDIVEMVDVDTFRVVDCPIVEEDEELENF